MQSGSAKLFAIAALAWNGALGAIALFVLFLTNLSARSYASEARIVGYGIVMAIAWLVAVVLAVRSLRGGNSNLAAVSFVLGAIVFALGIMVGTP